MYISAIIPIGNLSEDYENLLHINRITKFPNFEVIYILDNQKCHDLKSKFERTITFENKNSVILNVDCVNPGGARNAGLQIASGKFVVFWDSDDTPIPTKVLELVNEMDLSKKDIAIAEYDVMKKDLSIAKIKLDTYSDLEFSPGIWRWIIRSNIARNSKFPDLKWGEDQCYLASIIAENQNLYFNTTKIYVYNNDNPFSLTKNNKNVSDLFVAINILNDISLNCRFNTKLISFWKIRLCLTGIFRSHRILRIRFIIIFFRNFLKNPIQVIRSVFRIWSARNVF